MKLFLITIALIPVSINTHAGAWQSFENESVSIATTSSEKFSDIRIAVTFDNAND